MFKGLKAPVSIFLFVLLKTQRGGREVLSCIEQTSPEQLWCVRQTSERSTCRSGQRPGISGQRWGSQPGWSLGGGTPVPLGLSASPTPRKATLADIVEQLQEKEAGPGLPVGVS